MRDLRSSIDVVAGDKIIHDDISREARELEPQAVLGFTLLEMYVSALRNGLAIEELISVVTFVDVL